LDTLKAQYTPGGVRLVWMSSLPGAYRGAAIVEDAGTGWD